jgi:hypothetical protein
VVGGEAVLLQAVDYERRDFAVIFNYEHPHI